MRDKHVDLMLFTGIVFIVMGHKYQPPYLYFPAYSFHVGFFFFISGYLVSTGRDRKKTSIIGKKTKSQLIEYFFYNLLFCIITCFLAWSSINLGCTPELSTFAGLKNSAFAFFITPFITGHQYHLFIPAWFLLQLYIINIIFVFLNPEDNKIRIAQYAVIFVSALWLLHMGLREFTDYRLPLVRTAYGLFFFYTGHMIKTYKQAADKIILSGWFIAGGFIATNLLSAWGGNTMYSIVWGSVHNNIVLVPVLYTTIVILITYNITHYINLLLAENNIITVIAMHTKQIMIWHLSVFFAVNYILYRMGFIQREKLSDVYYGFNVEQYWLLYVIPGVAIPVLCEIALARFRENLMSKADAWFFPQGLRNLLRSIVRPVLYGRDFFHKNTVYAGDTGYENFGEQNTEADAGLYKR